MATLHVEFAVPFLRDPYGSSIHGPCAYYEALTISVTAATGSAATADQQGNADLVARLTTDTNCFVAIGSTPNTAATARTGVTTAKRYLAAGATISLPIRAGEKVGVIAA